MKPAGLVGLAKRLHLDTIALTDHDTMNGVKEAVSCADADAVKVIPGIEVSTYDYKNKKKAHLLCYFPKNSEHLLLMCGETLKKRTQATIEMVEKVSQKYPITLETVKRYSAGSAALYKQHICLALMDMGYSVSVFGDLYRSLFSKKYGWALVEFTQPDPRDAVRIIKETGGAAVLAHPGVYGNFDIIDELVELGLDGIEVFHPRQSEDDIKRAYDAAVKYNLLRTGGSDFHGMCSSEVTPLGQCRPEDGQLKQLISRFG